MGQTGLGEHNRPWSDCPFWICTVCHSACTFRPHPRPKTTFIFWAIIEDVPIFRIFILHYFQCPTPIPWAKVSEHSRHCKHYQLCDIPSHQQRYKHMYRSISSGMEPAHEILVLTTYATSEESGEPAHPRSLARAFAVRTHKVWK